MISALGAIHVPWPETGLLLFTSHMGMALCFDMTLSRQSVNGINLTIFIKLQHQNLLSCAENLNRRLSNHECRSMESLRYIDVI